MAVGFGSTHTAAVSSNGITWTGIGNAIFTYPHHVRWINGKWAVAASSIDTMASYIAVSSETNVNSGTIWTNVQLPLSVCNAICWNGREVVAVGGNAVAVSVNGINWSLNTDISFNGPLNCVEWSGKEWILGGASYYVGLCGQTAGILNLYLAAASSPLSTVLCIGVNREVGAHVSENKLYLNRGDKLTIYGPDVYDGNSYGTTIAIDMLQ
jgi:hypothetical protein